MIELGDEVRCKISGLRGIVTGRCDYLNGCTQFLVKPRKLTTDGEPVKSKWIDDVQLKIIKAAAFRQSHSKKAGPGGPHPHPPERSHP